MTDLGLKGKRNDATGKAAMDYGGTAVACSAKVGQTLLTNLRCKRKINEIAIRINNEVGYKKRIPNRQGRGFLI